VLEASVFPGQIQAATRWSNEPAHVSWRGEDLYASLQQQPWDPAVKALTAFPQVLRTLNDNIRWTATLGEAYAAQQSDVLDAVQELRADAQEAGTLYSSPLAHVIDQGSYIRIVPVDPGRVFVPAYDPANAYGEWPAPDYPPYAFTAAPYPTVAFVSAVPFSWVKPYWAANSWDWFYHRERDHEHDREREREHAAPLPVVVHGDEYARPGTSAPAYARPQQVSRPVMQHAPAVNIVPEHEPVQVQPAPVVLSPVVRPQRQPEYQAMPAQGVIPSGRYNEEGHRHEEQHAPNQEQPRQVHPDAQKHEEQHAVPQHVPEKEQVRHPENQPGDRQQENH
jgi:hypothetical protein